MLNIFLLRINQFAIINNYLIYKYGIKDIQNPKNLPKTIKQDHPPRLAVRAFLTIRDPIQARALKQNNPPSPHPPKPPKRDIRGSTRHGDICSNRKAFTIKLLTSFFLSNHQVISKLNKMQNILIHKAKILNTQTKL